MHSAWQPIGIRGNEVGERRDEIDRIGRIDRGILVGLQERHRRLDDNERQALS